MRRLSCLIAVFLGLLVLSAGQLAAERIHLAGASFDPADGAHPGVRGNPPLILIQFEGPVTRAMKRAVEKQGAELLAYVPRDTFIARFDGGQRDAGTLLGVPGVLWVGEYRAAYKIHPAVLSLEGDSKEPVEIDVELVPWADATSVIREIREATGGRTAASGVFRKPHRYRVRFRTVLADAAMVARALAARGDVLSVMHHPKPELLNDHSVWVIQNYDVTNGPTEASASVPRQYPQSATIWHHGLMGEGQIVAVADSGMSRMCFFEYADGDFPTPQELTPPDLGTIDTTKKVIAYYVEPGAEAYDHSSQSYHGTHVSGSVAGDNYANLAVEAQDLPNHDQGDGMAPAAKLVMQDVGSSGGLSGLSGDLTDMFDQAYEAGARIHTDSWGANTPSYTSDAQDMDEAMWRREDMIFTVAMGNSGLAPADHTIGAPATAKNVVSVGGVTNGGSSTRADDMTRYSRGPTEDERLKPDVVTPASSIVSAYGGSTCSTTTLSGTSMATPTTAGAVALLREYFVKGIWKTGVQDATDGVDPSGALLKAALINGAMPLGSVSGYDPLAGTDVSTIPSMDQGWGRTELEGACYFAGDAERVRYWDVRHRDGLETGETRELHVDVPAGSSVLAVTLVWSDPPATTAAAVALVNDLDLEVMAPDGTTYRGNVFSNGWSTTGGDFDRLNPVEGVRLQNPAAGTWTIRVTGYDVPGTGIALNSDRQGFAVVARFGECTGTAPSAPTGLSAADDPPNGVQLSWTAAAGAVRYLVYKAEGGCSSDISAFTLLGETTGTSYTDDRAYGGYTYAYRIVADGGCSQSDWSACASVTYTGPCGLEPGFGGLEAATNAGTVGECAVDLSWSAAQVFCPLGLTARYNVYRSTAPLFMPGPGNLLTTTTGLTYHDDAVVSGQPYYYVVRAEDSTSDGTGPNGGNEEGNTIRRKAVPWTGMDTAVSDFVDDGGDTTAWLENESPWTITASDNHTAGGSYSYRSALEGENYPAGTCAALTTPPLELVAGQAHTLTYWARYNIESDWDGVVVEISADGGTSWQDLPPAGGYPNDFSSTGNPPINACGYDASHGAFNGPSGNSAPTAWTEYTADLSAWDGQTVQVRWHLSTDPGSEFEGFWLDDISVTGVRGPGRCARHAGEVTLDAEIYSCDGTVGVAVEDADLLGDGTATVTVTSSAGDSETLTVNETPASSGHFEGTISTSGNAPSTNNGTLEVADGGTLQVEYIDADDGNGGTNVSRTASAPVDCTAPVVSNLQVTEIGATMARVTWSTDEPADSSATVSPGGVTASETERVTAHDLLLTGLNPCTVYTVTVASRDEAGNLGTGGPTAPFSTLDQTLAVDDDVESGTGPWTVDTAADNNGDPTNNWSIVANGTAHSPTHAWFSADEPNIKDDRLVAGPFTLGTGTSTLSFWHTYNLESSWDGGVLEISTDGGSTWQDVTAAGGTFSQGGYTNTLRSSSNPLAGRDAWTGDASGSFSEVRVDLSALAGSDVTLRFRVGCDGSVNRTGWWIDDIVLETPGPCPCTGPDFDGIVSATAVSGEPAADLAWNAADDTCNTGSIEYLIYAGAGGNPVDWTAPVASTTALAHRLHGLTPGTEYRFGVRARDGLGHVDSNTVEAGPVTAEGTGPDGDADCDGTLAPADIPAVVSVIFGAAPGSCAAEDANRDGSVDAGDPAAILRYLFDGL